jgi:serine/threonine protein kinase
MANSEPRLLSAADPTPAEVSDDKVVPGRILCNRYELMEEIGRGGLSRVYKARDLVAERVGLARPLVALKIIVADDNADPDVIALMHREARRLRELVHPNIVRVYDMNIDGNIHFMVMEYLEGQTLARALRAAPGHRLPVAQIDRLVADIGASLHHAHLNSIIHADLKPANIFVTTSGQLKLIDFNIAYPAARARKEDEEDTVEILGRLGGVTPAYASPQRLCGDEPSEGDDIFSFAVVIYLALTGVRPFGEGNALEAKEKGLAVEIPTSIPLARRMALKQALSLDDKNRMHSVAAFAGAYLGSPVSALLTQLGF